MSSWKYLAAGALCLAALSASACANSPVRPRAAEQQAPPQAKKGPFKGAWILPNDEGVMELDLYAKTIDVSDYDNSGQHDKGYGTFDIVLDGGMRVEMSFVTACTPDGNKAVIEYVGGRDGRTYRAELAYDPEEEVIRVVSVNPSEENEDEFGETYLAEGMVFYKK